MNTSIHSQSQGVFSEGCVAFNGNLRTPYGYKPSLGPAIVFPILFTILFAAHLYQTLRLRRITSLLFVASATMECIGWGGRIWSSSCPYNMYPFAIQLFAFALTPTFILLAVLLALRLLMFSRREPSKLLSANVCFFILFALVVISMTVQLVGVVAVVQTLKTPETTQIGVSTLLAGNILQIYAILSIALFLLSHALEKHRNPLVEIGELPVLFATLLSTIALFIRCIYHIAMDIQGKEGGIYNHQGYFIGFDAVLVLVALGIYNIFDPAVFLGPQFYHMSLAVELHRRSTGAMRTITHGGTRFEILSPQK